MKKVLILGAGNAQIDAIKYCKERGYKVYGCSYTDNDKGISYLDEFVQIDIKDYKSITKYANDNGVDAVYSVGSDLAVPSVMRVCEELNIPHFVSSDVAEICQNKNQLRNFLGNDFVGNIPHIVAENIQEALAFDAFPAMMKPTDSQGQRGCCKVESKDDIRKNFDNSVSFSKSGEVIIEKFIDGAEVSVNAYMQNGELKFALVSDRGVFDEFPGGIIKEHILPSKYAGTEIEGRIIDLVKRVVKKLGIENGPVYFQIKIDGDNPVLIEVTPRLDGCHMWNLINNYCGVNLLEASFEHLLSNKEIVFEPKKLHNNLKLAFFTEAPNKKFDRNKYTVKDNALYHTYYYETGENVKSLNGYMEKCGYQIYEE